MDTPKTTETPRRRVEITEPTVTAVDKFAAEYHVKLSRNAAAELLIRHALKQHGYDVPRRPGATLPTFQEPQQKD